MREKQAVAEVVPSSCSVLVRIRVCPVPIKNISTVHPLKSHINISKAILTYQT